MLYPICFNMHLKVIILVTLFLISLLGFSQTNNNLKVIKQQKSSQELNDNSKSINNYYKNFNVKADLNKSAATKTKNNDFSGAKSDLEKALALNPNNANTHLNYALLLTNNFNDPIKAQKHFEAAINIDPQNAKAHYLYAVVLKIFYKDNINARKQYVLAAKLKSSYISPDADKLFGIKR